VRVGLTYDLRSEYLAMGHGEEETAEFDRGDTIDHIEHELIALGHEVERIGHMRQLVGKLQQGRRWDLVFNIAEGLYGVGREAQVPAVLDAYDIPYTFSDPMVSSLTLHKGMTKHVLRSLGIPTSEFALIEHAAEVDRLPFGYPVFAKPVAEGTAKGIDGSSKIHTPAQLKARCEHILRTYKQAALVEPFLPGREFTTSLVGTGAKARVLGTLEIALREGAEPDAYTYVNKERCEELIHYFLTDAESARRCAEISLRAWRELGCRDAGRVDLRADAQGELQVLEVNPLPGMHPEHSDLPMTCTAIGMSYRELIRCIVESAAERVKAKEPARAAGHSRT
jgi:D-alanine-D-alanine ligase